jgi:hypothetical protein
MLDVYRHDLNNFPDLLQPGRIKEYISELKIPMNY